MNDLRQEAEGVMRHADCVHDRATVEGALDRMAAEIQRDLEGGDLVVVCVMNGGLIVTAALLERLHFALRVDYMHASRLGYPHQALGVPTQPNITYLDESSTSSLLETG